MKTYYDITIQAKGIDEIEYDALMEYLEDHRLHFEESIDNEYTIDERSEDEKYDDYLCTLADKHYEEVKIELKW